MKNTRVLLLSSLLALAGCQDNGEHAGGNATLDADEPKGTYQVDPATGDIRASHQDAAGVTTTMWAGENVPAEIPEPFTLYPGMTITNTTRVEQGDGAFVTIEFQSADPREEIVEFYRSQARKAGIDPDIEVSGGQTTTLGGENAGRRASFVLQVTDVGEATEGQLTVASGFD